MVVLCPNDTQRAAITNYNGMVDMGESDKELCGVNEDVILDADELDWRLTIVKCISAKCILKRSNEHIHIHIHFYHQW